MYTFAQPLGRALSTAAGAPAVVCQDTRRTYAELGSRCRRLAGAMRELGPGMTIEDVDVVEINEAFAAQVIPSARGIGVDPFGGKLNPHGGAIALGHPFGMTGRRPADP